MAKYDVTMSCGHVQTVQLFGKMTDRDKKIAWLEKYGLCSECQKRENAEETAKAAEKAIAENLPELTGTEKQVNWALTIRENIFTELDKMLENKKADMDADSFAKNELQLKAVKKVLAKFTEAAFWIENRYNSAQHIIWINKLSDEIRAEIANLTAEETTQETAENIVEETKPEETAASAEVDNSDNVNLTAEETTQETTENIVEETKPEETAASAEVDKSNDAILTAEETEQEISDEEYHKKIMKELAETYGEPTTLEKCREEFGVLGNVVYNTYLWVSNAEPETLEEYQVAYGYDLGTEKYNEANGIKTDEDKSDIEVDKSDNADDSAKNLPLAYNLGKVFATLQRIINVQKGDLEVYTAKTGGAGKICNLPLIEIAGLQRKANESLLKIKSRNADLAEKFERELCVVYSLLPTDLPHQLTADAQNDFLLGYYHQGSYMDAANFGKINCYSSSKPTQSAALQKVLESSREVIDDLRDE